MRYGCINMVCFAYLGVPKRALGLPRIAAHCSIDIMCYSVCVVAMSIHVCGVVATCD